MAGKLPAVRAVQGDCQSPLKTVEIPTSYVSPQCMTPGNPCLYLDQPIINRWCQPIESHVSPSNDSPTATSLGLFNSLAASSPQLSSVLLHVKHNSKSHECFDRCLIEAEVVFSRCMEILKAAAAAVLHNILGDGVVLLQV